MKTAALVSLILCLISAPARLHAQPVPSVFAGTVYNVFHEEFATDADFFARVDRDISAIAATGITHLLVFPLGEWDPDTRTLKWTRTDYLVRAMQKNGLKLVPLLLKEEQCSHYFPIWKFDEFPDLKAKHLSGGGKNNRENVDFADPRVFPVLMEYFSAVISRYKDSKSLAFYNVWNEPHYDQTGSHVVEQFRAWLKQKYGSLAALRRAWGDDYTSWDEVTPFLNDDWNSSMPAIDWRLFRNELNGELLKRLAEEVKKRDPLHPVNANPVGSFVQSFGPLGGYTTDNWVFTPHNAFNGGSYYPDSWDRDNSPARQPHWHHNFAFSTLRSAAGTKPYVLTEIYTNAKGGLALGGYIGKEETSLLAWTALANDAKGLIYWKWEPFMRGRQSLGRGLTRTDGTLAPRGEAVAELAAVLKKHGALLAQARLRQPEAGLLLDMTGLLKVLDQPVDGRTQTFMHKSIAGIFRALDQANITSDILRTDRDFSLETLKPYKILFLPFQVVMRKSTADILRTWVENGGILVADARTATVDELDFAFETSPGAGLDTLFGARRIDWSAAKTTYAVMPETGRSVPAFDALWFREQLAVQTGTTVLARFSDTREPAITSRKAGKGVAILAAVPLGATIHENPQSTAGRWLVSLAAQAGIAAPASFSGGDDVVLRVHSAGKKTIVYALNPSLESRTGTLTVNTSAKTATGMLNNQRPLLTATTNSVQFPLSLSAQSAAVFVLE
jgi:beta-galactosidase